MAAPISVTVRMPMTMPKVASTERILLARSAFQEIPTPSRISETNFITGQHRTSNLQHPTPKERRLELISLDVRSSMLNVGCLFRACIIAGNEPIPQADDAAGVFGD